MSTARKNGRGRPKGSRNKVTNEAKQAILMAFEGIGGVQRLIEWIQKDDANETLYWTKIFPLVVPRPGPEPAEAPEPVVIPKSFTWKTPEWAKKANKAQIKAGLVQIGKAPDGAAGEAKPPGSGRAEEGGSG